MSGNVKSIYRTRGGFWLNTCFASQGLRFDVDLGNVRGANLDEAEDVTV
jgi:hypothetical protein